MDKRELEIVEYTVEIWDWKTGKYVADISNILSSELQIEWVLNDVETVTFDIDLVQFEKRCKMMGVKPAEVLTPYVHDVRIRRNGEYILGCQVVETNFSINENSPAQIGVKCTGFLNLLKDRYITESWSGYSYAEIAQKLVRGAQRPENLTKNPTVDVDSSYWLCPSGSMTRTVTSSYVHAGEGAIRVTGNVAWIGAGTPMSVKSGDKVYFDVWVKGTNGKTIYFRERELISVSGSQVELGSIVANGNWQHFTTTSTVAYDDSYFYIETNYGSTSSHALCIDDCRVNIEDDVELSLCDLKIAEGVNTATSQSKNRQRAYSLQNVKDALVELTSLESDNFDFSFRADRTFDVFERKGSDKVEIEAVYPGNVSSLKINRSASNLANKITSIGSGIGDERLQVINSNTISRKMYGTREKVVTSNNVSLEDTLRREGIGLLWDSKDPTDLPTVTINDGSINPANVEVGDSILVRVEGDEYLNTINGLYRIMQMSVSVDQDMMENVSLVLQPPVKRPETVYIRYIKDYINGSDANTSNHWVEIQAFVANDNGYTNVAKGKTVTLTGGTGTNSISRVVDGVYTDSSSYFASEGSTNGACVVVDLGAPYPVDYIQVWHYYSDSRRYKSNTLSVGLENKSGFTPLDNILWQYSGVAYKETSQGHKSKWIQGGE